MTKQRNRIEVWFWEQMVFTTLLSIAVVTQFHGLRMAHALTGGSGAAVVLTALTTFAGLKMRSFADRERFDHITLDTNLNRLECHEAQARWSLVSQALGLLASIALAPSWAHVPVALYVGLYGPVWRPCYRKYIRPNWKAGAVYTVRNVKAGAYPLTIYTASGKPVKLEAGESVTLRSLDARSASRGAR